ncbi:MAG TPA: ATP-binding protein [Steroidobacteraceae bacterium]|nr:ATP-binding protein [Steroidobacteraceae bacterium]
MKSNRGLFIRSYVVLAGGLLVVAIVLDLGFSALQSRHVRAADPWLVTTFQLMESQLAAAPETERAALATGIAERLDLAIDVLDTTDISGAAPLESGPRELEGDDGSIYYLWHSPALNGAIRLGPFEPARESLVVRFLPVLFYASILLIVGLWLWPLLRDLRVLTGAAQKFATDYREPLDTASRTTQLTGLATNLDDMSARVSQLIQSQKEMTAALSHEMRTPLARVRFAAAVLEGEVDESLRGQLRAVNADVQQIDDLISDMLDYARLDHPGLRMSCQTVPLASWLRQVLLSCPPHEKNVTTAQQGGIDTAWMEPRLMELALSNLLANALRYAKQRVNVTVMRDKNLYRIVVEDDGEGIPESDRTAVFRAFTRLDTSRNRETGGFGLGLAIVARIAALHRGRVIAEASASLGGAKLALEWPGA